MDAPIPPLDSAARPATVTPTPPADPGSPAAGAGLEAALALHRAGDLPAAEAAYRAALARRPADPALLHLLAMAVHQRRDGRDPEAERLLRRSLDLEPASAVARCNLAGVLGSQGRHAEAADAARVAARLDPALAEAPHNLGVALEGLGRLADAAAAYRRAVGLRPAYAEAHHHLGRAFLRLGQVDAAAVAHAEAARLRPAYADAHAALAAVLAEQPLAGPAVAHLRRAADLRPDEPAAGSAWLYALHYLDGVGPAELVATHRAWAARHADPVAADADPSPQHRNRPDRDKRLRVGFVSPDFRGQACARFAEPALAGRDPDRWEAFCYSDGDPTDADADTARLRLRIRADAWRETGKLSDVALADLVRADGMDVLVDLRGHGPRNRLLAFARRPAPVQALMVGYFDTTGAAASGWRVTDAVQDPPGSEVPGDPVRPLRLTGSCWCYRPDDDALAVGPLPADRYGCVTFASLNKIVKASPPCLDAWARVLATVPRSRLVLSAAGGEAGNAGVRRMLEPHLARHGVAADRLAVWDKAADRAEYLARFARVADVALDPFPFPGITTTCDGLWHGVPCVTLAGGGRGVLAGTTVSRVGRSLLAAAGLGDLAAETVEQYVTTAAALAHDVPRLRTLRAGLRDRVAASPLANAAGYAARLEAGLRQAWAAWCDGQM